MHTRKCGISILIAMLLAWQAVAAESLDAPSRGQRPTLAETAKPATKLLLIGGPFDGHPQGSHEYMQGTRIMETMLQRMGDSLSIRVTNSEGEWLEGPNLVDSADGVVLFRWPRSKADETGSPRLNSRAQSVSSHHSGHPTIRSTLPEYRRLIVQAILWTVRAPVPADLDFALTK